MSDYDEGFRAGVEAMRAAVFGLQTTAYNLMMGCEASRSLRQNVEVALANVRDRTNALLRPPAPSETAAPCCPRKGNEPHWGGCPTWSVPARVATERACPRCGSTDFRCAEHEFCAKCTADNETRPGVHPYATERAGVGPLYPCEDCGTLRTKAEGGTTFTVCDACWDKAMERAAKCATCGGRGVVSPSYIDYRKPCETCGGTGRARGGKR